MNLNIWCFLLSTICIILTIELYTRDKIKYSEIIRLKNELSKLSSNIQNTDMHLAWTTTKAIRADKVSSENFIFFGDNISLLKKRIGILECEKHLFTYNIDNVNKTYYKECFNCGIKKKATKKQYENAYKEISKAIAKIVKKKKEDEEC